MASHAPQTITFVVNDGQVMTNGYSTRLAKGQFGIVDKGGSPTALGMPVVNSFSSTPKNRLFELKLGIAPLTPTRSQSNKAYSSMPFKLSEIVDIKVNAPQVGITVDEFIIGYDGINADTALVLTNGDNEVIDITLSGEAIGMLGYPGATVTVKLHLEAPNTGTFTMHEIVEKAVLRLKDITLVGGVPITEYLTITPVNSTNTTSVLGQAHQFFTLKVQDNGNHSALGLVQAAYPDHLVKRESYIPGTANAGVSTYVILAPVGTTLSDFEQVLTTQDGDCGNPDCTTSTNEISWSAGDTCVAKPKVFTLQLGDDCNGSRLGEVQDANQDLNVFIDSDADYQDTVYLDGSTGSIIVTLGSTSYTTNYNTSLSQTADDFVTNHAAAILAATGLVVTSPGSELLFVGSQAAVSSIVASGTLNDGTDGISQQEGTQVTGVACQTVYKTVVFSEVVCEECSPLLRDLFVSDAPVPVGFVHWTEEATVYDEEALMGIFIKSKVNILAGSEEYRDSLPFVYSSTRLSIANQAPGMVTESFSMGTNGRFNVKLLSIATEPEAMGGQFYDMEERTRVYFENRQRLAGNNYGKLVLGQESHLKPLTQYVDYVIRIRTTRFAQSFSGEVVENFDYHILVDACNYGAVQGLINNLADDANLDRVYAYGIG